VPNIQHIKQLAFGIREEGEARLEVIAQAARSFGGVDAHRVELYAFSIDFFVVAFELDQLGAAKRSPVAAIENVERGFAGLSSVVPLNGSILIGECVAGKGLSDLQGDGVLGEEAPVQEVERKKGHDRRLEAQEQPGREPSLSDQGSDSESRADPEQPEREPGDSAMQKLVVAKRSPRPRGRHHEPCQASKYQNR